MTRIVGAKTVYEGFSRLLIATIELPDAGINDVSSPTLARLIEEVRNEESFTPNAYNRLHNRHNRSR